MNKFKIIRLSSIYSILLGFLGIQLITNPVLAMKKTNLTQEEADKEFGRIVRQSERDITITQPIPDPPPATDEEYEKWEKKFDKEIKKFQEKQHYQTSHYETSTYNSWNPQGNPNTTINPYRNQFTSNPPTVGGLWDDLNNPAFYQSTRLSESQRSYNSRVNPSGSSEYNPGYRGYNTSATTTYNQGDQSYKPQQTYYSTSYKTEESPKKEESRSGERVKDDLYLKELAREHRELVERLRSEGKVQSNGVNISINGMEKYRNLHYKGNAAWHQYRNKYGEEPDKSLSFFACPALPGNFYTLVGQTW